MNTHADKTMENKSQSVASSDSQKQNGSKSAFQFVDNRPEAIRQQRLQAIMNNSDQVKQFSSTNVTIIQRRPFMYEGKKRDTDEFTSEQLAQMLPPDPHEDKEIEKEKSRKKKAIAEHGVDYEGMLNPETTMKKVDPDQRRHVISEVGSRTNRTMDEHHKRSEPIGFLKDLLLKYHLSSIDFALQADANSKSALIEYEKHHGGDARGKAHGQMARSLIAHSEIRALEIDRGIDENTFGTTEKKAPLGLFEASGLADSNKEEILKAYGITKEEHEAIRHYTNSNTDDHMKTEFGNSAIGWRHLSSAMEKLPSTGELGLIHSTFRAGRKNEGKKIMKLPEGMPVFHGYMPMDHGQHHYISTATTYSQFASAKRVGRAGGIVGMRGISGRYINPFGVQGSSTDGAEVLYPPSTFSQYRGSVNTGRKEVAYHKFEEIPPTDKNVNTILGKTGFVEDEHYSYLRWGQQKKKEESL